MKTNEFMISDFRFLIFDLVLLSGRMSRGVTRLLTDPRYHTYNTCNICNTGNACNTGRVGHSESDKWGARATFVIPNERRSGEEESISERIQASRIPDAGSKRFHLRTPHSGIR